MFLTVIGLRGKRSKGTPYADNQKENLIPRNAAETERVIKSGEVVVAFGDERLTATLNPSEVAVAFYAERNNSGVEDKKVVMFHCPFINQTRGRQLGWQNFLAQATEELIGYRVTDVVICVQSGVDVLKAHTEIKERIFSENNKVILSDDVNIISPKADTTVTAQATAIPQPSSEHSLTLGH